jgi:hypothetical protein
MLHLVLCCIALQVAAGGLIFSLRAVFYLGCHVYIVVISVFFVGKCRTSAAGVACGCISFGFFCAASGLGASASR